MPILLDAEGCRKLGGTPLGHNECQVTKEMIYSLASKLTLDSYGQAYLAALQDPRIPDDDESAILTQARYIANNVASNETEEQKQAWYQLSTMKLGKELPEFVVHEDKVSEYELEHYATSITDWTEDKERDAEGKIPLRVFQEYAEVHNVSLDKVLVCQDWVDDILSDEVIEAKRKAKERVKIVWD